MARTKLRAAGVLVLSVLLAAGGAARGAAARQGEAESLTPDERREAGEFLLSLDERWHSAEDFSKVFDDVYVADFVQLRRDNSQWFRITSLGKELLPQLSDAELKRAYAADLDFMYVFGRLVMTFEQSKKSEQAVKAAAAPGDDLPPTGRAKGTSEGAAAEPDEDEADASVEEMLSPPVVETLKSNPVLAASFSESGGEGGADEDKEATTPTQLTEMVSTLELATKKMRVRLKELEDELGGPVSAVPREDEDEGLLPELRLTTLDTPWMNRPAGTRVICGYLSDLHVDLVKEDGRYKVLAAYIED